MATTSNEIEIRKCSICHSDKTAMQFNKSRIPYPKWLKDGRGGWLCDKCNIRIWKLKTQYGLTLEQYTYMVKQVNYRCQICGIKPKNILDIDHDHNTGRIRGLLCRHCNHGLGKFNDNIELIKKALEYLSK